MRKGILAITSRVLKGSGGVAFLLLFLLAALSNAHATTLTPATVTASPASPAFGASVTLTAYLSGWVSAAGGTVTFETSTSSTGTYGTTLVTCGSSGSATVTAAASTTCQTSALPVGTTYVKAVYATTATGYAGGTSAAPAAVTVSTATLTPATVTASPASPAFGATVTLTANLSGWVSAAGGTITFETATTSTGTYGTTLVTCGSSGSATVTAAASTTCQTSALPVGTTYVKAVYATTSAGYAGATSVSPAAVAVTAIATTTTLTPSPSSTALGTNVTLTASVSPTTATGTVTFKSAVTTVGTAGVLGTCNITSGGTCNRTVATTGWTVSPTANSLTAVYAANLGWGTSTSTAKIVTIVAGTATTTGVVTLGTASPIVYGTSETLTASVSPTTATGTVTFMDNGTTTLGTGTISSGTATLTSSTLAPGTHLITAAYAGDATHDPSASASATSLIATSNTTTTLTAAATGTYGTTYSLMANVVPTAGPGTVNAGLVTFSNGSVNLGSCTIVSGTCSTSTTQLPPGSYTVTASYPGATNGGVTYNSSLSAGTSVTATGATLAASLSVTNAQGAVFTTPVAQGTSVLLTANVTPALAATGTVNFKVGGNSIASCSAVSLISGTATCLTASLPPGSPDSLSAVFTQTANTSDFASTTATGNANINVIASPTLVVSAAPYYYDATVTLNVSGFPALASGGTVSFLDGVTSLGSCILNSGGTCGTALSLTTLPVANHSITGSFAGNGSSPAASTASQNVNVVANPTTVTVASSATYVASSSPSPFTLTATVTTSDSVTVPAGNVTFYDSNISLGTGTVSAGTATLTVSAANSNILTTPGTHYLIASYGGNYSALGVATFAPSLSKSAKVVVESLQTISGFYNKSTIYGTPITLSAISSSAADPNGMLSSAITFSVTGTTGNITAASLSGNTLTPNGVGTITIAAALAGNANYTAATSVPRTFIVYPKPLTITAPSPTASVSYPLTYGSAVPAGSVMNPSYTGGFVGTDTSASLGTVTCTTNYAALSTNTPGTYKTFCYGATSPNYNITLVDGSFLLTKATPTPATLPTAATATTYAQLSNYALSGGTATGPYGSVGGVYSWTNPAAYLSVGSSSPSVTFKPSDTTDYTTAATTISISGVTAANPAVSWPTASAIPSTSPLSASTLTGGSTNGTFAWTTSGTTFTTSGVYSENVTFSPNSANYNSITHNINVTVTKGASSISCWPTGTTINYGSKLSLSTLGFGSCPGGIQNAGDTPGSFNWTSPNTIPAAGVTVNESATFTPSDTVNFSSQAHTTTLTVNTVNPTVSVWPTATAITYPSALSTSTLRGGSSGGTFAWTSGSTTPGAGTASYSVTFTPTGPSATDYNSVTNNIPVLVYQATATVSVNPTAEPIRLGDPLSSSEWLTPGTALDVNSNPVAGSFAWTNGAIQPGVGTSAQSATFTPGDSIDYTTTTVSVNITVNPCGYQDGTNFIYASTLNFFTFSDSGTTLANPVLDAETTDESAVCAVDAAAGDSTAVTITYPTITSGATASIPADSSIYGTNAAVLAYGTDTTAGHGATITIQDDGSGDAGSIITNSANSAGVFASMGGAAGISNTYVITVGNYSPALEATKQGALTITTGGTNGAGIGSVTAATNGNNSPVLATGIGGGTVSSTGGVYSSNGTESAGIHAAGAGSSITLNGDTVMAQQASAVEVNGNSSVTSTGATTLSGTLGDAHGIFLYYDSTPGDATVGATTFSMNGGSILYNCDATQNAATCAPSSPSGYQNSLPTLFSVANTTATITLTDVAVFNTTPYTDVNLNVHPNGNLLTVAALSGIPHSVGGNVTFIAKGEALVGDILVDSNSTVNLSLAADTATPAVPSTLTGNINAANVGTVNLTLGATSTWVVTGTSYLTTLTNAVSDNSNITCSGTCAVYVNVSGTPTLLTGVN